MSKYLDYNGLSHFKDKCDDAYANTIGTGYVKAAFTPDLNMGYGFSGFTQWAFNIPITEDLTLAITWIDTSTNTTYSCVGVTYNDGSEYGITVNAMTEVNVDLSNYVTITEDETITGEKTFNTVNAKVGNFTGSGINVSNIHGLEDSDGDKKLWIHGDYLGILSSEIETDSDITMDNITITSDSRTTLTDGTNSITFGDLISGSSNLYRHDLILLFSSIFVSFTIFTNSKEALGTTSTIMENLYNNYGNIYFSMNGSVGTSTYIPIVFGYFGEGEVSSLIVYVKNGTTYTSYEQSISTTPSWFLEQITEL